MPEISSFILSYEVLVPLFQAQPPPRQAGYVKDLFGIGGVWHGSLLITLPGVPQGPAVPQRPLFIFFSSSFHPLEKVNFSRDEHMLG